MTAAGDAAHSCSLVVIAFSAARWAAMGFNRIVDREFDARNPRTQSAGAAARRAHARPGVGLGRWRPPRSSCSPPVLLNPLCLLLSPVALAWVLTYSLTQAIHLVAAPLAGPQPGDRAGRRIPRGDGRWSAPAWLLLAVALAVATWVAGFDIFYALPDEAFDRGRA